MFSDTDMRCFKCGETGHLVRSCPEKQNDLGVPEQSGWDAAGAAAVVPPAAVACLTAEKPGVVAAPENE